MFANLDALHLTRTGQFFFAAAVIGIGIEHFIFNDFIMGRAPAWPETYAWKNGLGISNRAVFYSYRPGSYWKEKSERGSHSCRNPDIFMGFSAEYTGN